MKLDCHELTPSYCGHRFCHQIIPLHRDLVGNEEGQANPQPLQTPPPSSVSMRACTCPVTSPARPLRAGGGGARPRSQPAPSAGHDRYRPPQRPQGPRPRPSASEWGVPPLFFSSGGGGGVGAIPGGISYCNTHTHTQTMNVFLPSSACCSQLGVEVFFFWAGKPPSPPTVFRRDAWGWAVGGGRAHGMQGVSCCNVAGWQGQELRCVGSTLYIWRSRACIGCPHAGSNTELMVCSGGRM